jgi:hypothetical protein
MVIFQMKLKDNNLLLIQTGGERKKLVF